MNDLRRDINEVFARQQSQLDDVSGAGNRMLREATAGRRINRQLWPSLAGVALVLIAASAIGVSVVIRGLHQKRDHPSVTDTRRVAHSSSGSNPDVATATGALNHTGDPLP